MVQKLHVEAEIPKSITCMEKNGAELTSQHTRSRGSDLGSMVQYDESNFVFAALRHLL
jgi:hypothetical protein